MKNPDLYLVHIEECLAKVQAYTLRPVWPRKSRPSATT